ncbi:MAG: deoxyguanosinetriphosphate triphosphohydrolase [Gammaproteobacteria bacterium]
MNTSTTSQDQVSGNNESLATYAAHEDQSSGRQYPEKNAKYRSMYQRDRERIIHSAAFRRLEYKTQVFVNHEGDLFRTRLTHSIEVAQIARAIARALKLNEDLCEAISLAHDLGHTPFGHAGQDALNDCMRDHGGFEHNLQSLRIVDELELKYPKFSGLNLTFETREGILKHCSRKNAEKLGELGLRFINRGQPSLEAQLANIADQIAYNNHDLDDGLRAGLINVRQLSEVELFDKNFTKVDSAYPHLSERRKIYESIRSIINELVTDLITQSADTLKSLKLTTIQDVRAETKSTIRFSEAMYSKNAELKSFLNKNLYQHYKVHRMSQKAKKIILDLYMSFYNDIKLMPSEYQESATNMQIQKGDKGRARIVADYIAGMTDRYAIAEHERIFNAKII